MLKWIECGNTEQEVRGSSPGGSGEGIVGEGKGREIVGRLGRKISCTFSESHTECKYDGPLGRRTGQAT